MPDPPGPARTHSSHCGDGSGAPPPNWWKGPGGAVTTGRTSAQDAGGHLVVVDPDLLLGEQVVAVLVLLRALPTAAGTRGTRGISCIGGVGISASACVRTGSTTTSSSAGIGRVTFVCV